MTNTNWHLPGMLQCISPVGCNGVYQNLLKLMVIQLFLQEMSKITKLNTGRAGNDDNLLLAPLGVMI